jgi:hypothetical protein
MIWEPDVIEGISDISVGEVQLSAITYLSVGEAFRRRKMDVTRLLKIGIGNTCIEN